jgi:hypothetical protein
VQLGDLVERYGHQVRPVALDVTDAHAASNAVKAAAVIMRIASLDEPPLRLLLGSNAVHLAEQNDLARIEGDRKWRELSVSTDFEAAGGSKTYPWEQK